MSYFDHDNEGKEAPSPHAAMARRDVEKAEKAKKVATLKEPLSGFWQDREDDEKQQ